MSLQTRFAGFAASILVGGLTLVIAQPVAAQTTVRAEASAAYRNAPVVEYQNQPGAVASNYHAGWNYGAFAYGESHSGIGQLSAICSLSQPAGGPRVTVGGVNSSGRATFSDFINVGGDPGSKVTLTFSITMGGDATKVGQINSTSAQIGVGFQARYGSTYKSCAISHWAGGPTTGTSEFTLVVPAGSRISIFGSAFASVGTAQRTGSPVSTEADAAAYGEFHITASAPFTSDSGYAY